MDILPDGTIRVTDHVIEVSAGENLSARDAVYVDASGDAYKCDATDLAKIGFAGFVIADALSGNTVRVRISEHVSGFSSLTPGSYYYLSETPGAITATKPTNYKVVCKAITDSVVKIVEEPTVRVRTYTSSGTWTKPAGLLKVLVKVQAAGGGSGTGNNNTTSAGGGGGYTEDLFYASELGATETVTVGAGGVGGVVGGTTAGQKGGDSSFGSLLVATGGNGSASGAAFALGGGVSTPGYFAISGTTGREPIDNDDGSSQRALDLHGPGVGFLSLYVPPFHDSGNDRDYQGPAGVGYGYGGASVAQDSQPSDIDGEDGGDGIIIVTEYY